MLAGLARGMIGFSDRGYIMRCLRQHSKQFVCEFGWLA